MVEVELAHYAACALILFRFAKNTFPSALSCKLVAHCSCVDVLNQADARLYSPVIAPQRVAMAARNGLRSTSPSVFIVSARPVVSIFLGAIRMITRRAKGTVFIQRAARYFLYIANQIALFVLTKESAILERPALRIIQLFE